MSDQQSKVDASDARKAFMDGVVTHTSALDVLEEAAGLASDAPKDEVEDETIVEEKLEKNAKEEVKPKKHSAQERIQELANRRKAAEQEAADAKRENAELKARLKALETSAPPIAVSKEPQRHHFVDEQEYIDAVTDYRVERKIAEREEAQKQAKIAAEMEQIDVSYSKTVEQARATYDDFAAVVGASKLSIPDYLVMAIKESEVGGDLTYYLAKNPEEAKKVLSLRPVQALKYINSLEQDLLAPYEPIAKEEKAKTSNKKAPEPINPVRGTSLASMSSSSSNFEEYRAKRQAAKRN